MKHISKGIFLSSLSLIFLNACSDKKEEKQEKTFKTVNYYDTHKKERDSRLQECQTMKEMTKTILIDCENANTSIANESRGIPIDTSNWVH